MGVTKRDFQVVYIVDVILVHIKTRLDLLVFKKNLNASKPSEHPPQVEECLKV